MEQLKLNDYIKMLQERQKKYGNLPLIYAQDDVGNSYGQVLFSPTPMKVKGGVSMSGKILDSQIIPQMDWLKEKPTHICIN